MKIVLSKFLGITLAFFMLIAFSFCTNTQKEDKSHGSKDAVSELNGEEDFFGDEMVLFSLPSPGEIIERLKESDIFYSKEFTNPAGNNDKYVGLQSQALNLGVYIADMAYSAVFTRSNETIEYLDVIQTMGNEINISTSAFESLAERSKANIGNMDSLLMISNEAFYNMIDFLETGGKENVISLVSAGAYLESIYIALSSVEKYEEDNEILNQIVDLKYPMDNLRERTTYIKNDPNVKKTINYLNEVENIFNEFTEVREDLNVEENNAGSLVIGGGESFKITEDNFILLKNKITEMRNTIVKI
ncbi:MAG: hypothetical protein K9H49_08785 [Bacteroidales bacterium]|nr:hypothetical protein [Bacteroidales bacterium]MCF8389525.1 hypothetical protein [Bacteroidales bacterium]